MTILTDHNAARRDYEYDALVKEREQIEAIQKLAAIFIVNDDNTFTYLAPVEFHNIHTEGGHA